MYHIDVKDIIYYVIGLGQLIVAYISHRHNKKQLNNHKPINKKSANRQRSKKHSRK